MGGQPFPRADLYRCALRLPDIADGPRAIAVVTVALFVAACVGSSGPEVTLASNQELHVRLTTEPASFDPGQTQWDYEAAVARQTFEGLLRTTKDGKDVTGAAADSYTTDSTGTVYTFKLHSGARWSDGQPVKAADFVYGFQRLLDPRLIAPNASFYYGIKNGAIVNAMDPKDPDVDAALQTLGLKAVDDKTFQVTLEAPAGYFKWIASLWTSAPVRKDIVAKYGKDSGGNDQWGAVGATAAQTVVGNGLFKILEDVPKDHVTLVPNTNYSGSQRKPTLTKIIEFFISDDTVAYAKYRSGELDMTTVPSAYTDALRKSPELVRVPALKLFWMDMNVQKAPFDNLKVRLAFSKAIDRDSLATTVSSRRWIAASTLIPRGMRNYRPDLGAPQKFDGIPAGFRAAQLPDSRVAAGGFLDLFGRPARETPCECERTSQVSLGQALSLVNGPTIADSIIAPEGRIARLMKPSPANRQLVEEIYLATICRLPKPTELSEAYSYLAKAKSRTEAAQDLMWALINTPAFLFNR